MVSRINPTLVTGDVVTDPRSLAYYIVTEYGGEFGGLQHLGASRKADFRGAPSIPGGADFTGGKAGHLDPVQTDGNTQQHIKTAASAAVFYGLHQWNKYDKI